MLSIGSFELHLINDCTTHVDGGGAFGLVPRKLWRNYFEPDEENNIRMAQNCLYVRAGDRRIVIDTGLGSKLNDRLKRMWNVENEGGLLRGLDQLGVRPEDIDLVICTHLHADHCSGNTRYAELGSEQVVATFPNAEYVVQRREYEDAMHPNERTRATYFPINYQPLVESGQMRLLDGDTQLLPGIDAIVTPGHTPGHMSVRFEDSGQHAAFLCDLATYAVHFERLGWMTAYDVEPLRTLETKRIWQRWALETGAILFFPHDPYRPAGQMVATGNGGFVLQTVELEYLNV